VGREARSNEGRRASDDALHLVRRAEVRKQLVEVGRHYFKHNTIVTNGTMELPDWPNCTWVISIDGTESLRKDAGARHLSEDQQERQQSSGTQDSISCVLTSITKDCGKNSLKSGDRLRVAGSSSTLHSSKRVG